MIQKRGIFLWVLMFLPAGLFASLTHEFVAQWPAGSYELERRTQICMLLLETLDLRSKLPAKNEEITDKWIEDSINLVRWLGSSDSLIEWERTVSMLEAERPNVSEATDQFLKFSEKYDFDSRRLELQLMIEDLANPRRFRTKAHKHVNGPDYVPDGLHIFPWQWHSLLSTFVSGDLKRAEDFSLSLIASEQQDLFPALLFSLRDLRLGLNAWDSFYLSYETMRAEIMIARTWKRLGEVGRDFLHSNLKLQGHHAYLPLETLNLLETVYPLRWKDMTEDVIHIAFESSFEINQNMALLYLLREHRHWLAFNREIALGKTGNMNEVDHRHADEPHPLLRWKKELRALSKSLESKFQQLLTADEDQRDTFQLGVLGGLQLMVRYLNEKNGPQKGLDTVFPEYDHELDHDFDGKSWRPAYAYYRKLVLDSLETDLSIESFNRGYYELLHETRK